MSIGYHPDLDIWDEYNQEFVNRLVDENRRLRSAIRSTYIGICEYTREHENRADALSKLEDDHATIEAIGLRGHGLGARRAELILLRNLIDNGFGNDISLIR